MSREQLPPFRTSPYVQDVPALEMQPHDPNLPVNSSVQPEAMADEHVLSPLLAADDHDPEAERLRSVAEDVVVRSPQVQNRQHDAGAHARAARAVRMLHVR